MDEMFAIRARHGLSTRPQVVRSALLHISGWFVLWLEGPEEAVEAARERAALDPRNHHQQVIHRSCGPATLTESFSAATTQVPISPSAYGRCVLEARSGDAEPAAIWQRLSAPCIAPLTDAWPAVPRQYVALLAADANGPIELLRSLGERNGTIVAHQRFASCDQYTADVGVTYLDLRMERCTRRILLLSRRALGHELVRQSLASLDTLVLVLGTRHSAAVQLAHSVPALLDSISQRPCVHLVGHEGAVVELAEHVLHACTRTARLDSDHLYAFLQSSAGAPASPTGAYCSTALQTAFAQELQIC